MLEIKTALKSIVAPRFSSKLLKMTDTELRERKEYLERYMFNISPRVSLYASLKRERDECDAILFAQFGEFLKERKRARNKKHG